MAATRTKTIEYMLPMLGVSSALSEGTSYTDSGDTTIYIPETTDRAFTSVTIEIICHDSFTNSSNPQGWGIRGSCDGGLNWTTVTKSTNAYTETDEVISHVMVADITAEFSARFSGASDTFRYGFYMDYSAVGPTIANVSAKLYITYTYDDTAQVTRIKTVRIPIESFNGRLSNTSQIVGQASTAANQLPALKAVSTPFLPEDTTVIRQAFLELYTNTLASTTTNSALILKIDSGGSETTFGTLQGSQTPATWVRYFLDVTSVDWTTAHELYARHDVASQSYYAHLGGWLTVTYEYNHTNSETILNSLVMGLTEDSATLRTSTDKVVDSVDRFIVEPDTITMVQSGAFVTFNNGTTNDTINFKVGTQTATAYTPTGGGGISGMVSFVQRIDAGGHRGAALTLARGLNTFTSEYWANNADRMGNVSATLMLNYTSGKHTSGADVHAQSRYYLLRANHLANQSSYVTVDPTPPAIIESTYWLASVVPVIYQNGITGSLVSSIVQIEKASGGWKDVYSTVSILSNERQMAINNGVARSSFKRYPTDPDTSREDIEVSRTWRYTGLATHLGLGLWITYHAQTWTISGTVSEYADADGAGITVGLFRSDTRELIGTTTTTIGGAYSFTWYDNTVPVFAEVYEDATHAGRSANAVAA